MRDIGKNIRLARALFALCLIILMIGIALPAAGMALPRLYSTRSAAASLFFLLGAGLWLTQPDGKA